MPMKDFKNLIVWSKAHQDTLLVYKLTKNFPREELFGITSQLRRAATSVSANIAEGCGKFTQADFARYLQNALGSNHEVEYLSILAHDLNFLGEKEFTQLSKQVSEVKAMLITLIKKVRHAEDR